LWAGKVLTDDADELAEDGELLSEELRQTPSVRKLQGKKIQDIQVTCGLLFPEFSTLTP
jgi:hypothetical protein